MGSTTRKGESALISRCWKLFSTMLMLSAFTFGGGFVIVPLMRRRFVEELGWLSEEEILDMAAFAQASPGAVSVNVAVQIGARTAGAAGALCGALGTLLPPLAVLSVVSLAYDRLCGSLAAASFLYGLRLAVSAVISFSAARMAADILRGGGRARSVVMCAVFLLCLCTKTSVIWLLAGSVILGLVLSGRGVA